MNTIRALALVVFLFPISVEAQKSLFLTMGDCEMEFSMEGNVDIHSDGHMLVAGWAPDPNGVADCLVEASIERALDDYFEELSETEEGRAFIFRVRRAIDDHWTPPRSSPEPTLEPDSGPHVEYAEEDADVDERLRERLEQQDHELTEARRLNELHAAVLSSFATPLEGEAPAYDEQSIRTEWQQSRRRLIRFWQQSLSEDPGDEFARRMLNILESGDQDPER